jgi:hypothetical protein
MLLQHRDAVRLCHEQCLMAACYVMIHYIPSRFKHLPDVQYMGQRELQYSDISVVRKIGPAKMSNLNTLQRQGITTNYFAK